MKQRVLLIGLIFYSFLVAADDTVLKLYRPFGEEQGLVAEKKRLNGRCDAQSKLIIRDDAWRCQAEDKIFDPCFAKAGPNQMEVSCPLSPWTKEGVLLSLSRPLNNEEHVPLDMSRTFPWAIELVSGERCQAVESGELYDSMPVRYRCVGEHDLVGIIQRCNPTWSMLEKTPNGIITMDLKQAWF